MRRIIKITHIETRNKNGREYYRTYALIDDGTEVIGWSEHPNEYHINDKVEVFLDNAWNTIKMQKPVDK